MTNIAEIVDNVKDGQTLTAVAVEEQTAANQEIARSLSQAAQQAELVTADVTAFLHATVASLVSAGRD
jgi:transcriptional antiterminator Rof (Rho-off)